jgi:Fe-S cluster assembly iron-binding protein IscA
MTVTEKARERLLELLRRGGAEAVGFRFPGWVGACRGSTPRLKLAVRPECGETLIQVSHIES